MVDLRLVAGHQRVLTYLACVAIQTAAKPLQVGAQLSGNGRRRLVLLVEKPLLCGVVVQVLNPVAVLVLGIGDAAERRVLRDPVVVQRLEGVRAVAGGGFLGSRQEIRNLRRVRRIFRPHPNATAAPRDQTEIIAHVFSPTTCNLFST